MAINKKLIFWKSSTFNPPTSPSDTTKDVLWNSIVFFDSTAGTYANSIWTHGKVFGSGVWGTNQTNYVPLAIGNTTYNLSKDGHTHSYLPLSGGTITGQVNLTTTTITTPPANTIALAAKSDGLYQKIGTVETKLALTTDLTWANITSKPTTLAGYGIVDAYDRATTDTNFEIRRPTNGVYNNLGSPTIREAALFHGQMNNKLRFIPAQIQEESTDGTVWTTSTRATNDQLKDVMLGEGQVGNITAIPTPAIGGRGYYRLTWDSSQTGYVYLSELYIYNSTSGNNVKFKVEGYQVSNSNWIEVTSGTISNWPGHTYIPHTSIPFHPTVNTNGFYRQMRITFSIESATYTNPFTIYSIEWFGGYPAGRRNIESYDRYKNVTFPASVNATSFVGNLIGNATSATTATTATKLSTTRTFALTGDVAGSVLNDLTSGFSITTTLANSGVSAGTYRSVTVDAKGRVTAGTNPTTLADYGITDAVTINTRQDILGSKVFTKSARAIDPSGQPIMVNGIGPTSSALGDYAGIGFHNPGISWANLIYDGSFRLLNNDFSAYQSIYALSFVKSGGTATQFLMADGSSFDKPTTLAGYGITDAYTKAQVDTSLNDKVSKSGDTMTGNLTAPTFIGALQGNAMSATGLQYARTLWGQLFDGNSNVSGTLDLGSGDLTWGGWGNGKAAINGNGGLNIYPLGNQNAGNVNINGYMVYHTGNLSPVTLNTEQYISANKTFAGGINGFVKQASKTNPTEQPVYINGTGGATLGESAAIGFHNPGRNYSSIVYHDGLFKFMNSAMSGYNGIMASTGNFTDLTANYIPKHSASGLTNSLIYDNGTNVGIGTTDPQALLQVGGTNNGIIRLKASSYDWWDLQSTFNYSNPDLIFSTSTGEKLRINASGNVGIGYNNDITGGKLLVNGNVGIGTTNPFYNLDVVGTINASTSITAPTFIGTITNASALNSKSSTYYTDYDERTLGDSVNFNNITYDFQNRSFIVSPVYPQNFTGQTNTPFIDYGQMITFGGLGAVFPFQLAVSDAGKMAFRCKYRPTNNTVIDSSWWSIYHTGNSNNVSTDWTARYSYAVGFYESSDIRLKTNIKELDSSLAANINLVEFDKQGKHGYGVIAQEIEQYYPTLVTEGADGYKTVNYTELAMIKIKYLEEKIKELERKIKWG